MFTLEVLQRNFDIFGPPSTTDFITYPTDLLRFHEIFLKHHINVLQNAAGQKKCVLAKILHGVCTFVSFMVTTFVSNTSKTV